MLYQTATLARFEFTSRAEKGLKSPSCVVWLSVFLSVCMEVVFCPPVRGLSLSL